MRKFWDMITQWHVDLVSFFKGFWEAFLTGLNSIRAVVAILATAIITAAGVENNNPILFAIGVVWFFLFLVWEVSEDK